MRCEAGRPAVPIQNDESFWTNPMGTGLSWFHFDIGAPEGINLGTGKQYLPFLNTALQPHQVNFELRRTSCVISA